MKKIIIASVLIVGLAAGVAYSHGNGRAGYGNHMMGSGYGMMGGGNGMMSGGYGMMGGGNGMMGGGNGMMGGNGVGGNYNDCPGVTSSGQGGWNSETQQKFLDETVDLRKEMNDKRFAYVEAQRNPDTSREQLAELEKEMIDLRTKLSAKAELLQ